MDGVTKDKITPDTVNAACMCADKAIQLLRLNLDAHKYFAEAGALQDDDE